MRGWRMAAVLAVGWACSSAKQPAPAPPELPAPESAPAAAPAPTPPPAPLPPSELPPITLARPPAKQLAASVKLNTEGHRLHKAKDHAGAIAKYREALALDAGNLLARYNLASALAASGEGPRALAELAAFTIPDCRACIGILRHARGDAEWKALHGSPSFDRISDAAVADVVDLKDVSTRLVALLEGRAKTDEGLIPYFHPRDGVKMRANGRARTTFFTPAEVGRFGRDVKQGNTTLAEAVWVPEKMTCDATCCLFGGEPSRSDMASDLEKICFDGVGGVLFLSTIEFSEYMDGPDD